jgi:hypothetical protein
MNGQGNGGRGEDYGFKQDDAEPSRSPHCSSPCCWLSVIVPLTVLARYAIFVRAWNSYSIFDPKYAGLRFAFQRTMPDRGVIILGGGIVTAWKGRMTRSHSDRSVFATIVIVAPGLAMVGAWITSAYARNCGSPSIIVYVGSVKYSVKGNGGW